MVKLKRGKYFVKHHIVNRCKGGSIHPSNLLRFEQNRERVWHYLFNNLSFQEVAYKLKNRMIVITEKKRIFYQFLFGNKNEQEIAELLLRTVRAKKHKGANPTPFLKI